MVEATETAKKPEPIWRCQAKDCPYSTPPTLHGYNQIAGHQLHHSREGLPKEERVFLLVDQNTNEVLAKTLTEAREKGLLKPPETEPPPLAPEIKLEEKPQPTAEKPAEEPPEEKPQPLSLKPEEEPPEEKPEAKKKEGEITEPQVSSDGIFKYTINLPSDAFTLFNLAKAFELEKDNDKPFDVWVWECITARFKYDYKMQLVLAPIQERT